MKRYPSLFAICFVFFLMGIALPQESKSQQEYFREANLLLSSIPMIIGIKYLSAMLPLKMALAIIQVIGIGGGKGNSSGQSKLLGELAPLV